MLQPLVTRVILNKQNRKEECSFLKKRTKKLLLMGLRASCPITSGDPTPGAKVFCFFFSKNKSSFFLA
jgi:hypothetical protein